MNKMKFEIQIVLLTFYMVTDTMFAEDKLNQPKPIRLH